MRQDGLFWAAAIAWAAAFSAISGCGDDRPLSGAAPDFGAPDAGAPSGAVDASADGNAGDAGVADGAGGPDGGAGDGPAPQPASCDTAWHDLQIGTELDDQLWGMAADANGHLYVAGFEHGITGVTNIEPDGDSRGVVIQIDLAGEVQWRAAFDTTASDTVEGVAVDPANGAVVAVGRTSGAFEGFVNQGQFDSFLAELDSGGRVSAIFQSGDERPQHPSRLSLGGSHLIAVAGFDDTYVTGHSVEAQEDGFVASFERGTEPTASFTQTLLQKVPLSQANRLTDVVADRDGSGSMYVTSFVSGPRASAGIFVKKLNSDGSPVWSTRISALTFDAVNAVGLSPSNELFVAGATGLSLGGPTSGGQDAFVSKIDKATGAILWTTQAGSSASDYPRALAFDELGNIYIAGETLGSVVGDPKLPGGTDVFAMKLNAAGTLISAWQTGTAENDFATSLVVDHCGRVLVGGYTKGALVENGHDPAGRDDMYVVRAAL